MWRTEKYLLLWRVFLITKVDLTTLITYMAYLYESNRLALQLIGQGKVIPLNFSDPSPVDPPENMVGVVLCDHAPDRKIIHSHFEKVFPKLPERSALLHLQAKGPPVGIWVKCPFPNCREKFNLLDRLNHVDYDWGEQETLCPGCRKKFVWDNYDLYGTSSQRYDQPSNNAILFGPCCKGFEKPTHAKKSRELRESLASENLSDVMATKFKYCIIYVPAPKTANSKLFDKAVSELVDIILQRSYSAPIPDSAD